VEEGFEPNKPDCFLWKFVTMHLWRETVESALRKRAKAGCATGIVPSAVTR